MMQLSINSILMPLAVMCILGINIACAEKWETKMNQNYNVVSFQRSLFAKSKIYVKGLCGPSEPKIPIAIEYRLIQRVCRTILNDTAMLADMQGPEIAEVEHHQCSEGAHLGLVETTDKHSSEENQDKINPLINVDREGLYVFEIKISSEKNFDITLNIEIKSEHGYLSAADWPLLHFYGIMCIVYFIISTMWLAVSLMQWRELLRIQFWIGSVIFLGMLEKAIFYEEYHNMNVTGTTRRELVLAAEWISCLKRALARMLVIIVSLGFGIVKPRLGSSLHRVLLTGCLYFILACIESYLRLEQSYDPSNKQIIISSVPLAIIDSIICWWIFSALIQTTRTLRLRGNIIKLTLYKHFTNTLIFCVASSVVFMLYSIKIHRLDQCMTHWKDLWIDSAFWHVLFSLMLVVIIILWRPTKNNQRYAFTPLLDAPEDGDEDCDQFVSDAYGVKMRTSQTPTMKSYNSEEDLKWVEENIANSAIPILDSDEELVNTKFEISKMQ